MKKSLARFLFCGGLFWASAGFAVSRVGGGFCVNPDEGFSYAVPQTFQVSGVSANDTVQFHGGMFLSSSSFVQERITQYLLRREFPDLADVTDREKAKEYFLNLHWTEVSSSDPCLLSFVYESASGYNRILAWGNGRGVIFAGPNSVHAKWGVDQAFNSLKIDAGACSWK